MNKQTIKNPEVPDGCKLELHHFRLWEKATGETYLADLPDDDSDVLNQSGGVALVDVYDEQGNWLTCGQAVCSRLDNYNKKLGRYIATGRALKNARLFLESL